ASQPPKADAAATEVRGGTASGSEQKPAHRPIEFVLPDREEVDVVSQARNESRSEGRWRNFHDRYAGPDDELPQHRDMLIKRTEHRVFRGLTLREKKRDLGKEVITDPDDRRLIALELNG